MPWVVHEVKPLPEKVAQAQQVLGHRLHILIGHFLAGHPASRLGAIIESVGGERTTIRAHLKELEAAGVVTVDVPPDQRAGRTAFRYSVDRDRWFELGVRLISYLPAEPAEPRSPLSRPRRRSRRSYPGQVRNFSRRPARMTLTRPGCTGGAAAARRGRNSKTSWPG
jgi:DNA-binding transcriptional ArsR family regulator